MANLLGTLAKNRETMLLVYMNEVETCSRPAMISYIGGVVTNINATATDLAYYQLITIIGDFPSQNYRITDKGKAYVENNLDDVVVAGMKALIPKQARKQRSKNK